MLKVEDYLHDNSDQVSDLITRHRAKLKWSITELAARSGLSASTISRIERGTLKPSEASLTRLIDALSLNEDDKQLLSKALNREESAEGFNDRYSRIQRSISYQEERAQCLRGFDWSVVPGLLQTERYARWVFSSPGNPKPSVEEACKSRMERKSVFGRKSIEMVISEHVLRSKIGTTRIHHEQLEYFIDLHYTGQVLLHVLPVSAGIKVPLTCSFKIFDENGVSFETSQGAVASWNRESAVRWIARFNSIKEHSITGEAMVDLIKEVQKTI